MFWPAAFLSPRLLWPWIIAIGLAADYLFVSQSTSLGPWRSIPSVVAMNAIAILLGMVLIPVAGIGWEVFPGLFLYWCFRVGTFNPATWIATFCIAVLVYASVELTVLSLFFGQPWTTGMFWWLCLTNSINAGLAMSTFLFRAPLPGHTPLLKRWRRS